MAKERKDVKQRQGVAEKYKQKVYRFPEDATSYDDLRDAYLHLADIADRRLRRLEEYAGKDKKYENILKFAYDRAIGDIQAETGYGKYRFAQGVPKTGNIMNLKSRINDVLKFLNSPSSTISGIKRVYGERAKQINERYGLNLTWENMADFFENEVVVSLKHDYASDTAMKIIGKYYRNKDEINDIFKQYDKNHGVITAFTSSKDNTKLTAKQMRSLFERRNELNRLTKKLGELNERSRTV